jgi:hypothetical protein
MSKGEDLRDSIKDKFNGLIGHVEHEMEEVGNEAGFKQNGSKKG